VKVATIALGAAAAVVLSAGAATATWMVVDGGDASQAGQCAAATYSLEAEREDGALEISFELQTDAPGQAWEVEVAHDGDVLLAGERQTDTDAEIDVDVNAARDSEGEFTATATPVGDTTGEPCTATLTVG
jgi:hypothetical protein